MLCVSDSRNVVIKKRVSSRTNSSVRLAGNPIWEVNRTYFMLHGFLLCNRRLIVLQAKIPAGASEAAGIGHQTEILYEANGTENDRVNEKQSAYIKTSRESTQKHRGSKFDLNSLGYDIV
jgi:hypothetical protein